MTTLSRGRWRRWPAGWWKRSASERWSPPREEQRQRVENLERRVTKLKRTLADFGVGRRPVATGKIGAGGCRVDLPRGPGSRRCRSKRG